MIFWSGFPPPMGSPFRGAPPKTWVGLAFAGILKNGVHPVSDHKYLCPCQKTCAPGIRVMVPSLQRRTTCTPCAFFCMVHFCVLPIFCTWCSVSSVLTSTLSFKRKKEGVSNSKQRVSILVFTLQGAELWLVGVKNASSLVGINNVSNFVVIGSKKITLCL